MVENVKREPLGNGIFVNVSDNHKFGTDAILLANFSAPRKKDKAVDIGTGCGIIPLLWLREDKTSAAVGIDISDEATALLSLTKEELNLDKLTVINSDILDIKGKIEFGIHTLVTCNPPYKAEGAGLKSRKERERVARHETACTLEDIVAAASRLLQTSGRLCMCHRPERLAELICLMKQYKLEPKRLRTVAKRPGNEPWLILVEAKKCANVGLRIEPTLFVEDDKGNFSKEMIEIYGAYKEAYL